ncbi:MAG TPA: lantibiotic dehydratase [Ktedonobacteraceae bacterium]|nr:lantibiotic dehydratase [Ktedonobacteraceae bacterium]
MVIYQEIIQTAIAPEEKEQEILLAPYFLMRVTGLPFSTVEQIQFSQTSTLIQKLLKIESWQSEHSDALQNNLREQCKKIAEKAIQHKGLDLRRAIAAGNGQKAQKLLASITPYLPEALVQEANLWCQQSIESAELLARGEATFQAELLENRKQLHQLFRNEDFQHGLLLSSETLYNELQNYLQTPLEKNNNRVRRTEEGLLSYLVRMATKTSPFSTFCSTTLGAWNEQAQPSALAGMHNCQQSRITRLSNPLFTLFIQTLTEHPAIRPHLYVSLNTTLRWIGERSETQNDWGKIEILDQEKIHGRRFDYNERLARIRLNPLTYSIIKALEKTDREWSYQRLLVYVVDSVLLTLLPPVNDDDERKKLQVREQITHNVVTALEHLAAHAVITLDFRIPAHEDDKLHCLIQRLATIPGEEVREIRADLEQLYRLSSAYSAALPSDCAQLLKAIRDQAIKICQRIDTAQKFTADAVALINKLYPSLILEDVILPFARPTLAQQRWEPVLADLRMLHKLAPLLDFCIIMKLHMDRWASSTLRGEEDFITCYLRFWQDFMPNRALRQEWEREDSRFIELRVLQDSLFTYFSQRIEQAQQAKSRLVQFDPMELQHVLPDFPDFIKQTSALAHFGQLFIDQQEPYMILNSTWAGPGVAFSRFSHLFTAPMLPEKDEQTGVLRNNSTLAEAIQAYTTKVGRSHQTIYASIAETGDINVNTHAPLTPYEILFPFSCSQQASELQLPLRDLYVTFDKTAQEFRIFSRRLNCQVTPMHYGFSLVQMMPPLYQALVTTTERYPIFDIVTMLETQLSAEQKRNIRHYPRLAFGHVILNRECWKIPVGRIPQREPGETNFEYCLKMNRWRIAEGLPSTCFRRIIIETEPPFSYQSTAERLSEQNQSSGDGAEQHVDSHKHTPGQIDKTLRKPFYVDFQNGLLLSLLNTALKSLPPEMTLTFEEVLPTPEQHLLKKGAQSYATECILELSC